MNVIKVDEDWVASFETLLELCDKLAHTLGVVNKAENARRCNLLRWSPSLLQPAQTLQSRLRNPRLKPALHPLPPLERDLSVVRPARPTPHVVLVFLLMPEPFHVSAPGCPCVKCNTTYGVCVGGRSGESNSCAGVSPNEAETPGCGGAPRAGNRRP